LQTLRNVRRHTSQHFFALHCDIDRLDVAPPLSVTERARPTLQSAHRVQSAALSSATHPPSGMMDRWAIGATGRGAGGAGAAGMSATHTQ
jgi:hypothetical protein